MALNYTPFSSDKSYPPSATLSNQKVRSVSTQPSWNQLWNQGWNEGFNNPTGSPSQGGGYATGFSIGQQEYQRRNPRTDTTGGTTNSQPQPPQPPTGGDFGSLIETSPQQPNFEDLYGSVFDTAFANIESAIGQTETETQQQTELAKQAGQGRVTGVQERLGSQQKQLDINKQELVTGENEAQNQLRQQVAEMNQGVQARYGATTGTGKFASEILGRTAMQALSANRQNLANKISTIELNRNDAIAQANKQIFESNLKTQEDIAQLQATKNQTIQELRNQKGMLGIERSKLIVDAVNTYNKQIDGVRQRNAKFYQDMYLKQVDFENKVKESQLTAYKSYVKEQNDFNNRVTRIFLGGGISDEAIPSVERQLGLPQGQLQQVKKKDQYSTDSLADLDY